MAAISVCGLALSRGSSNRSPAASALASYYLLAAGTLLLARDLGAVLRWGVAVVVVVAIFLPTAAAGPLDRLRICRFVVYVAAAMSLYAVVEVALDLRAIWGPPPLNGQGGIIPMDNEILVGFGLGRAEVTLVEPLLLSFLLLVALGLALRSEVLPRRRVPLIGVLLCGLLASGSRSAAAVAVLLFIGVLIRSLRLRLVLGVIATVGAAGIAVIVALLRQDLVDRVLANPSVGHRLAGVEAAVALVGEQSWLHTIVGNGYGQVLRLFREGRLQSDGFFAVDNQFAYTFAELGVAGLVVLGWLLWKALTRTDRLLIPAMTAAVIMFLSFDVLANASSLGLLVLLLGLTRRATSDRAGSPEGNEESRTAIRGNPPGDTGRTAGRPAP
jgi:hypothetical protein